MAEVKKNKPEHVLALIRKHTKAVPPPPPPKVIPARSLWDRIKGRKSG